ncbi:MAG TPA: class D beta-lactamase [Ignavibacteriaceae bacterium]|nr:class D beta-lactamase [Ignavibacteriaceae bacterium]
MKLLTIVFVISLWNFSSAQNRSFEEHKDWEKFYKEKNIYGCFLLYDLNSDKYLVYNKERIDSEYIPASTFKIFNSLAGLECGAVKDENEIIKWDGVHRDIESWNRDHNMRTAFRNSVVWFYQEIARRIGYERMRKYINLTGYGNKDIDGGIDLFWLQGDLRITPVQQIEFLVKLYKDSLPFSKRTMDIVKEIMILEQNENYILRVKTGWGMRLDKQVGWYVGYVETAKPEKNLYFFVNNIDIKKDGDADARELITREILRRLKIID